MNNTLPIPVPKIGKSYTSIEDVEFDIEVGLNLVLYGETSKSREKGAKILIEVLTAKNEHELDMEGAHEKILQKMGLSLLQGDKLS